MLVSLDIRFNLKIEIASPVSNTQHKNKLLCIRATGHPLPLFPLWPEDKQINGWISATCRSLQGHPGDCTGNSTLIFFFLFQSLWANSGRKHLNLPVQISRHYNECQSDIELMRCNQAVLMFNSVEILPSANKLRMTNATAFWVNRHSFQHTCNITLAPACLILFLNPLIHFYQHHLNALILNILNRKNVLIVPCTWSNLSQRGFPWNINDAFKFVVFP